MKNFIFLYFLFAIISATFAKDAGSGCSVRIADLPDKPQPLYLQPGTSEKWPVSSSGNLDFEKGDLIELFCPTTFTNPSGKSGSQTAKCVSGTKFKIGNENINFAEIICDVYPDFEARETGEKCNGGNVIEIGFQVGSRFIKQMEICFDKTLEGNRYSKYSLSPENKYFQRNVVRTLFSKKQYYNRKNVEKLYTQSWQNKTIGSKYIIVDQNLYLARGHAAAKADFIFANEQRATFLFINAAPQWQSFNAGNWVKVEDNTRNWVAKRNINVDVYTGVYGVASLPNDKGVDTKLYLNHDKNNNGLIPVPALFFRVIIEPSTKKGIVLIGVNNPYLTLEQIKKEYIICKDVSDKLDWLTWKKDDIKAGYSYACEVNDFAKKNPNLPKFDVKGLLL